MAQLHFTLDSDFFVGLFSETKDEAFGKLMEALLNQVLQAESTEQLGASNYERSQERSDYRNGVRTRTLTTRIGKIELQVPRHRNVPFKTSLFENYQRNEQALITTMMEMVVQGVSTRNIKKVTEELCGESFSKSAVSEICKELDVPVKHFKERLLPEHYPFIIVDAIYLKAREDHRVKSKALFVAIGINNTGHKEVLGFEVYDSEKVNTWRDFFENLKSRGLRGVDIVISDAHAGLVEAIKESFSGSSWQRCQAHFTRNIIDKCPKKYSTGLASELRDMFNAATIEEARRLKGCYEDGILENIPNLASAIKAVMDEHRFASKDVAFSVSSPRLANPNEMKLFVNTFTKALLSGNNLPVVEYTDAVLDDSVATYKSYVKFNYDKFANHKLSFSFRILDADLISNEDYIKDAVMYIYTDPDGSRTDGDYDPNRDIMLGHIHSSGTNGISLGDSGTSVIVGKEYIVDDLFDLIKGIAGVDETQLRSRLGMGTLKIGITALDSKDGKGISVLTFDIKNLFDLD